MSEPKLTARNLFDSIFQSVLPRNASIDFGPYASILEELTFGPESGTAPGGAEGAVTAAATATRANHKDADDADDADPRETPASQQQQQQQQSAGRSGDDSALLFGGAGRKRGREDAFSVTSIANTTKDAHNRNEGDDYDDDDDDEYEDDGNEETGGDGGFRLTVELDAESAAVRAATQDAEAYALIKKLRSEEADALQRRIQEGNLQQFLYTSSLVNQGGGATRDEVVKRLLNAKPGDAPLAGASSGSGVGGGVGRAGRRRKLTALQQLQLMLPHFSSSAGTPQQSQGTDATAPGDGAISAADSSGLVGESTCSLQLPVPPPPEAHSNGGGSSTALPATTADEALFEGRVALVSTAKNYGFIAPGIGGPDIYFSLGHLTFTFSRYVLFCHLRCRRRDGGGAGEEEARSATAARVGLSPEAAAELERGEEEEEEEGEESNTGDGAPTEAEAEAKGEAVVSKDEQQTQEEEKKEKEGEGRKSAVFPPITAEEKKKARYVGEALAQSPGGAAAAELLLSFFAQLQALASYQARRPSTADNSNNSVLAYSSCISVGDTVSFRPCYNSNTRNNNYYRSQMAAAGGSGEGGVADSKVRLLKAECVRGSAAFCYCNRLEQAWFYALFGDQHAAAAKNAATGAGADRAGAAGRRGGGGGNAAHMLVIAGSKATDRAKRKEEKQEEEKEEEEGREAGGEEAEDEQERRPGPAAEAFGIPRYTGTVKLYHAEERRGYIQCDEEGALDVVFTADAVLFDTTSSGGGGAGDEDGDEGGDVVDKGLRLVRERLRVCYSVCSKHALRPKYTATLITALDGRPLHAGNCVFADESIALHTGPTANSAGGGGGRGKAVVGGGGGGDATKASGSSGNNKDLVMAESLINSTQNVNSANSGSSLAHHHNRDARDADYENEVLLFDDDFDML